MELKNKRIDGVIPQYLWLIESNRDQQAAVYLSEVARELSKSQFDSLGIAIEICLNQSSRGGINSYLWVAIKRSLYIKRNLKDVRAILADDNYLDHAVILEFCRRKDYGLEEDAYKILEIGTFSVALLLKKFIERVSPYSKYLVPCLPCIEDFYGEKPNKSVSRLSQDKEG